MEPNTDKLIVTTDKILNSISTAFPELAGKSFEYYVEYVYAQGISNFIVALLLFGIMVLWLMKGFTSTTRKNA